MACIFFEGSCIINFVVDTDHQVRDMAQLDSALTWGGRGRGL